MITTATAGLSENVTLLCNYAFRHLDWRHPAAFNTAADFMDSPEHKFMVGTRYDAAEHLHLSSHLYFVDGIRAPIPAIPFIHTSRDSYWRLDLRGEYEFADDRGGLAIDVTNPLDSAHFEGASLFVNDAEVPQIFFVELRLTFK